jgi:thioredoxin-dependent peroxiredoxin
MVLNIGDSIPNLVVSTTHQEKISLAELAGKNCVIYFYPKDSTPACTTEAQNFRDLMPEFTALNCTILGVSRDSVKSHQRFTANECLAFDLISDVDETVCQAFDVIKLKNMYGKQVLGIERSSFLFIDGQLRHIWTKVKAQGHAQSVLNTAQQLINE